jgi:hypothetical protein
LANENEIVMMKKTLLFVLLGQIGLCTVPLQLCAQFTVHNNGALVTVNPGCVATVKTGNLVNGSGIFNNAGDLTVEGNLVNSDQLSGGGANSGVFRVQGNWVNNQTFNADQSLVILNGGNQSITGTAVSGFHNLRIQGTGIKSLTLDANVSGILQLNNLELATQGNMLHVQNAAANAITATTGFVSSTGNGRLAWDMSSGSNYVFPVGSSAGTPRIRPVALNPSGSGSHTFAVRMANVNPTSEGFNTGLTSSGICDINSLYFHLIDREAGSGPANVTQYFNQFQDGIWDQGASWQGGSQWVGMGAATAGVAAPYSTVTTAGHNDFSTAFTLINAGAQAVMAALPETVCLSGSTIALSASPVGGQFTGPGVSGTQFVPSNAGVGTHLITYSYTTPSGCTSTSSQTIQVVALPQVSISSNQPAPFQVCQGTSITLNATLGFDSYTWSNGSVGSSTTVSSSGTFTVTAVSANGCSATSAAASVQVNPSPTPVITANGPLSFCQGGSVTLSTATGFGSYNWSNGGTGVSTTATTSGIYTVTVTNQFLCSGTSAQVEVNVTQPVTSFIDNVGDSLFAVPTNGTNHQWFFNGNPIPGATQPHYLATESGNYVVRFRDENGCITNSFTNEFTHSGGNISVYEVGVITSLELFPNPGAGIFTVRGVFSRHINVHLVVTDMLGRELMQPLFSGSTDQMNQEVDITGFANGVYFVKVAVGSGLHTFRYIKT